LSHYISGVGISFHADLTFHVAKGSYAEQFAIANGIKVSLTDFDAPVPVIAEAAPESEEEPDSKQDLMQAIAQAFSTGGINRLFLDHLDSVYDPASAWYEY